MKEKLEFLYDLLEKQYGNTITEKIISGYKCKRYVTLRVNAIKSNLEEIMDILNNNDIIYENVSWYDDALIIKNKTENDIRKLDIYNDGKIYLQSLSSMIPPLLLDASSNDDILDMTSAPGSKTCQIASILENRGRITAMEIDKVRIERLKYNLERQGVTCCYPLLQDSTKIDDFFKFDKILLDAPCSGSGTLSLDEDNSYFSYRLIDNSSKLQYKLLKKAIKILKPGCTMIYSTCSILEMENENVLNKIIEEEDVEVVPIDIEKFNGIELLPTKIFGTMVVCPNNIYEGFFIAKIRKIK